MNRLVDRMLKQSQKTYGTMYIQWRDAIKALRVTEESEAYDSIQNELEARQFLHGTYESMQKAREDLHLAIVEANL